MARDDAWISLPALSAALARVADALDDTAHDVRNGDRAPRAPDLPVLAGFLLAQLRAGTYRFAPLHPLALGKPDGSKRELLVPPPLDRAVQGAAAQWLAQTLDRHFASASHGYRPGRGVQTAQQALNDAINAQPDAVVLDADIERCFDEITHESVIAALRGQELWGGKLAWVIRSCLRAEVRAESAARPAYCLVRGLPQGSPLSPVLANLVLDGLDRALMLAGFNHVRYADDFVVICRDDAAARTAWQVCDAALRPLGLRLKATKTRIVPIRDGFAFLGLQFNATATDRHRCADTDAAEGTGNAADDATDAARSPPMHTTEIAWPAVPSAPDQPVVNGPGSNTLGRPPTLDAGDGGAEGEREPDPDGEHNTEPDADATEPLLRTLYLLEPRTTLERDGDSFRVTALGQPATAIPATRLHQIFCFGEVNLSSGAIALALEQAVPIMLLGGRGRYFGVLDTIRNDNLDITRAQYRLLDDDVARLGLARAMLRGKLGNSLALMRRLARTRPEFAAQLPAFARSTADAVAELRGADSASQMMGIEGAHAARYFDLWRVLLPPQWGFAGRKRQPPPDPVNSLLSYGYTLLYYNLLTLVLARGLQPHLGVLHSPRSGHHALVSDLMEEFRAPAVDALVLDLILNRKVKPDGFAWPDNAHGPCLMAAQTRRRFIEAFERKLNGNQADAAPGDGGNGDVANVARSPRQRLDLRRRLDIQTLQLTAVLRGHAADYEPYRLGA